MSDWADEVLKSKIRDTSYERLKKTVIDFKNMGFFKDEIEVGISNYLASEESIISWICVYWLDQILEEVFEE